MLYRIGTHHELLSLSEKLPLDVRKELSLRIALMDDAYGSSRDYLQVGGYCLIVEAADDLDKVKSIINYEEHPCEWAERIGKEYVSALFVLNDDYTLELFMPVEIAPKTILNEMEETL